MFDCSCNMFLELDHIFVHSYEALELNSNHFDDMGKRDSLFMVILYVFNSNSCK